MNIILLSNEEKVIKVEDRITGVMIYYYFVCHRKLWYFCHEINMEADDESVMLGKLLDESTYRRDEKHINIDNIINIDFLKEHRELHEIKKSRAIEDASVWQVKYYLYYLSKRGVLNLKARIDYPLLKRNIIVELSQEDIVRLEEVISEIIKIKKMDFPPLFSEKSICKKCAYHDLCFI